LQPRQTNQTNHCQDPQGRNALCIIHTASQLWTLGCETIYLSIYLYMWMAERKKEKERESERERGRGGCRAEERQDMIIDVAHLFWTFVCLFFYSCVCERERGGGGVRGEAGG